MEKGRREIWQEGGGRSRRGRRKKDRLDILLLQAFKHFQTVHKQCQCRRKRYQGRDREVGWARTGTTEDFTSDLFYGRVTPPDVQMGGGQTIHTMHDWVQKLTFSLRWVSKFSVSTTSKPYLLKL